MTDPGDLAALLRRPAAVAVRQDDPSEIPRPSVQRTSPQLEAVDPAYLGGHTCADVARVCGIAPDTAAVRIRAGLIALREAAGPIQRQGS